MAKSRKGKRQFSEADYVRICAHFMDANIKDVAEQYDAGELKNDDWPRIIDHWIAARDAAMRVARRLEQEEVAS